MIYSNEGQFGRAETMFRRAISLNPNYATAHQWFSDMLGSLGRREEALSHAQRAAELDPCRPSSIRTSASSWHPPVASTKLTLVTARPSP